MYKYKIFFFLATTLFSLNAQASEPHQDKINRFTLSTGYLEETFNSNEGMSSFPLSIYETYNWGFNKLSSDDSTLSRSISLALGQLFTLQTYLIVSTPFHEFGHATRFRYFGAKNIVYGPTSLDALDGTVDSFFKMVIARIPYALFGFVPAVTIPDGNQSKTPENNLISAAGGMNNEVLLSKNHQERIFERGAAVTDLGFYIVGKMSPIVYSSLDSNGGDPIIIQEDYTEINKTISTQDLRDSYLFSFLASGSLYSLLNGNISYIKNSEKKFLPLNFYGFYLPDFYVYLNKRGLSLETMLHYAYSKDLDIGLSYETVYLGDSYHQIAPQVRYAYNNCLFLKPQLMLGFGTGSTSVDMAGSLTAELENDRFGLSLKYTYYNASTLYGERNEPFKNNSHEILAGVYAYL